MKSGSLHDQVELFGLRGKKEFTALVDPADLRYPDPPPGASTSHSKPFITAELQFLNERHAGLPASQTGADSARTALNEEIVAPVCELLKDNFGFSQLIEIIVCSY